MKVLWFVNVTLPELSSLLDESVNPFGGWLVNLSHNLSSESSISLHIASPFRQTLCNIKGENIVYHTFSTEEEINVIAKRVKPDVIHVFGTEYKHSETVMNVAKKLEIKTIVSIQGLVSVYSMHLFAALPPQVIFRKSIRNSLKRDSLFNIQKKMALQGEVEKNTIKLADYVTGRTEWDLFCVKQIAEKTKYIHCNEVLRNSFYFNKWDLANCEKFRVFISQGHYPIKGLHIVLESLVYLKEQYPNIKICVAGHDITAKRGRFGISLRSNYENYIIKFIKKHHLKKHITFMGLLDESEMKEELLKSHVYLCPSSIENSPNSLGEAMILGVPCIASYVGGIPSLLESNHEGFLYQFDAPYMLAGYIGKIFNDDGLAKKLSKNAISRAEATHSVKNNKKRLMDIYNQIIDKI